MWASSSLLGYLSRGTIFVNQDAEIRDKLLGRKMKEDQTAPRLGRSVQFSQIINVLTDDQCIQIDPRYQTQSGEDIISCVGVAV